MSETEAKTDAPTAEEIKGTKRAAEVRLSRAKKGHFLNRGDKLTSITREKYSWLGVKNARSASFSRSCRHFHAHEATLRPFRGWKVHFFDRFCDAYNFAGSASFPAQPGKAAAAGYVSQVNNVTTIVRDRADRRGGEEAVERLAFPHS